MKKRNVALLALGACAVPLVVGQLHAQPRLRDRITPPGGRTPAAAPPAADAAPADEKAGAGAAKAPTIGPSGKAQADTSGLSQFESALEFEPRSPNYKVAFSLEDADLNELVRVISQLTGKRFIFGGKVKNIKASVYSPQKVTVAEAYQAFLSILEANKLTVVPHGRFLKIIDTDSISSSETPIYGPHQGTPHEDRFVTRMHRLGHISADDAAALLGKFKSKDADITVYGPGNMVIITDTGTNIRRLMTLLEEIDVGSSGDQIFIEPIHYSSAQEVEKKINDLFDVRSPSSPPSGPVGRGGAAPSTPSVAPAVGDLHVAKIVADERSNSLIIVATERAYLRMLELIKRIDVPQTGEGEIHVLPLQHADATELTKTLNDIITGAGGGAGAAPQPGGRGAPPVQAAAAQQGIFEGGVKVSADKATNAIVITSSLRDYVSLRAVIDRLDQPRRQVFIEAVIMDLQLKRSDTLGVSFHGGAAFESGITAGDDSLLFGGNKITNTILPIPSDPEALQGFALGVRGPGIPGSQNFLGTGISIPAFGTFIQAIARTGDTDLLSTPHILALDNEDAEINVGDNVPLQTNQGLGSLAGLGATGVPGAAGGLGALGGLGGLGAFGGVARQDVGTKIKVKPHLNDSNEVRLDISEEISEVGANVGGTSGAFQIGKRTATTKLVVADQQTIVIGGLIRNVVGRTEEKIPVLGDIPVLGALFRKRTNQNEKRNLILVLTPYIIRSQDDLRTVFERKMQERQEYLDRYFVFNESSDYKPPKDWSRTNGLVEDIRQAYLKLEERKRLDEIARPKTPKTHDPQQPLEMPQNLRSRENIGGGAPPTPAPGPGGGTPPLRVNPATRNVDRVEN
ncbi:MAG TPA: type II secretion system secretin GspD [Labilithrix sp.]|nr:type II secretion system secretin GspD [Labilithrix sp.]